MSIPIKFCKPIPTAVRGEESRLSRVAQRYSSPALSALHHTNISEHPLFSPAFGTRDILRTPHGTFEHFLYTKITESGAAHSFEPTRKPIIETPYDRSYFYVGG